MHVSFRYVCGYGFGRWEVLNPHGIMMDYFRTEWEARNWAARRGWIATN